MTKSGLLASRRTAILVCLLAIVLAWAGGVEAKKKEYVLTLNGFIGGKLLFPQIDLWNRPGGPADGGKAVESLKSGTKVKIVGRVLIGETPWYLVTNFGPGNFKNGWVPEQFLRGN